MQVHYVQCIVSFHEVQTAVPHFFDMLYCGMLLPLQVEYI